MGRIRTIKPSFTTDEELSALSAETHLLAAGLLCYADDEGFFNANPGLVKGSVFPLRDTSLSTHDMLIELANIGFIRLGTAGDGKRYGHVVKFTEHQRVNRPTPSKISGLQIVWDDSVKTHAQLTESSLPEGNKEGNKEEENTTAPPAALPSRPEAICTIVHTPTSKSVCAIAHKPQDKKRGTRIPESFTVTNEHREFARKNSLPNPDDVIDEFKDYWKAVPGQRGCKLDWDATFRNRLREVVGRKKANGTRANNGFHHDGNDSRYEPGADLVIRND